jgi:hypothetical protein
MTEVLVPGPLRYADPYCAPSQAAGADSYTLQRIWADVLSEWRLPATHQVQGIAMARAMTQSAYSTLHEVPSSLQQAARDLLAEITASLGDFLAPLNPAAESWPIRLAPLDDQSALLEWIRADRRLGFLLSDEQGEAGWFFVYSNGCSERYEAGTMDQLDLNRMVRMMIK